MNCNKCVGANLTGSLTAGAHKIGNVHPALEAAHITVGLVTDLYHTHVNACVNELLKALLGVVVKSLAHLGNAHSLPRLGNHLLCRVSPEVGVVEVNEKLHAVLGGTLTDLNSIVNIAVSAAVAVSVLIKRIVPDSDTDIVYTVGREDLVNVLLAAVIIVVLNAAGLKRRNCRGVHTHNEALGKVLNLLNVERIRLDVKNVGIRSVIGIIIGLLVATLGAGSFVVNIRVILFEKLT